MRRGRRSLRGRGQERSADTECRKTGPDSQGNKTAGDEGNVGPVFEEEMRQLGVDKNGGEYAAWQPWRFVRSNDFHEVSFFLLLANKLLEMIQRTI
ncbi:unnamed protein product [Protopolystoma xenopodis]|uniref:Uncharacterized protein n=1 Tax=Protopolystoma xenopodis TaxID=117903 RepID=A0A448WBG7_9PLAT|nr:unnamed protein product [Protopolystoma xenopodis]